MKKFNIKESFRKGVKNKRLRHGSYSMGPVSYTHLDVYKRQGIRSEKTDVFK